jgi:hypothetical protein
MYRTIPLLLILATCAFPVNAQGADASLPEILKAVQKNVDFLKEHLVDLISEEVVVIEEFDDKGKTKKITNIVSEYRTFPEITNAISDCSVVYEIIESLMPVGILREERELQSVKENNKAQRLDRYKFNEHFWAGGSSFVELLFFFDKQNEKCFDYDLKGVEKNNSRDVYVIGIKQKEASIGAKYTEINEYIHWGIQHAGSMLIDAETMEIVRLNRNRVSIYYNTKRAGNSPIYDMFPYSTARYTASTQYEYEKVKIRDQYLTLPVAKTVELIRSNGKLGSSYKYRYSNHRAFGADTKISFDTAAENQ